MYKKMRFKLQKPTSVATIVLTTVSAPYAQARLYPGPLPL